MQKHLPNPKFQINFNRPVTGKNAFFARMLDKASDKQIRMFERKRKLLAKIGIHEDKIIQKVGIARSFKIAKAASVIDIVNEGLTALTGLAPLGILAYGTYMMLKVKHDMMPYGPQPLYTPEQIELMMAPYKAQMEHFFFQVIIPYSAIMTTVSRVGVWVGNLLDYFQLSFVSSVAASVPDAIKPRTNALYREFCKQSIRELAVDVTTGILSWLPIPFLTLFRRVYSVKSELKQLRTIGEMERIYVENKEKGEEEEFGRSS
jgi:hypothetical protein